MKRLLLMLALACLALGAPSAQASFGLHDFDVAFSEEDGATATQAGSHPFAFTTSLVVNYREEGGRSFSEGRIKDILLEQAPGLVADSTAYPRCSSLDFLQDAACPLATQVGVTAVSTDFFGWFASPVFNLTPPPGVLLRLGWNVAGEANIVLDVGLSPDPPYVGLAASRNTPETVDVISSKTQLWGDPTASSHDALRGSCLSGKAHEHSLPLGAVAAYEFEGTGESCPVPPNPKPFLTLPTSCSEPLATSYEALAWDGASDSGSALTHDSEGNPQPFTGCGKLGFKPSITAQPTTKAASSPTGLDFSLDVHDEGLQSVTGLAQSDIEKAVVTLPEGMSVNPSQAEGLEVCTEAELEAETLHSQAGEGCPQAAKIGSLEVESPLVEEAIKGALYVAKPYENLAGDSLLAVYAVFKNPKLGIIVKQPLRVEPDPVTGQLTTVAEDIPQLPFSHFRLHFREGTRSPLSSPPTCGTHTVEAMLYPWSGGEPVESTSTFQIISGPDNSPCPSGGLPPFHPGLEAGGYNDTAGAFSPFYVRLFRSDSEQEITHFSIKLPPGVVGKLAGIPFCSDAAITAATARTGPLGGHEELANPSCPPASYVGRTLVGSGVGPSLAYAPGNVYLAGPYHGTPISIVAITAGVVGPFDLGTVVVREALRIDPETAEVFIDATGSDPIPHIIQGIPVHLRDIRVYTDRPEFVLNPTDCTKTSTASTVLGSGLNFASEADDNPITVSTPFQVADCAALPFKPKLKLRLLGGTKRGAHPKLRAELTMRPGEANIAHAQVTLPHTSFLDQSHIRTVCTRVQFAAGAGNGAECPPGSVYGWARAITPILSDPLEGPVYLRSSEHKLPDLIAALHNGEINIDLIGRIDSVKGRIRNTFEAVPDAPVSKFVLTMQGAAKGLIVNSTDLCAATQHAVVDFTAHNGKVHDTTPAVKAGCKVHNKGRRGHKRHHRSARR